MAAAGRGNLTAVRRLLELGADVDCTAIDGSKASDWAMKFGNTKIAQLLKSIEARRQSKDEDEEEEEDNDDDDDDDDLSDPDLDLDLDLDLDRRARLSSYQRDSDTDQVDHDLIVCVLRAFLIGHVAANASDSVRRAWPRPPRAHL